MLAALYPSVEVLLVDPHELPPDVDRGELVAEVPVEVPAGHPEQNAGLRDGQEAGHAAGSSKWTATHSMASRSVHHAVPKSGGLPNWTPVPTNRPAGE
jgi:hypothetical protein